MWKITKDLIFDPESGDKSSVGVGNVGRCKKCGCSAGERDVICSSCESPDLNFPLLKYQFRLLDDDGAVYYEGLSSSSSSFAPLDDYGMPNDGCVAIQYRNKTTGEWEYL